MWHVVNQKQGVSVLGLQRVLGLGSYRTAWTWMHKLRVAMVRPGRDRLGGTVEVNETWFLSQFVDDRGLLSAPAAREAAGCGDYASHGFAMAHAAAG